MPTTPTTYLRFAINEDVLSLRDLVSCLRIDKKDIHAMRLVDIGEDDWNTYEFDINGLVTAKDLDDEFGGTYVIKNVYLNGIALEEYEYDDTESTQETVDSDLLNDTEVEDDESEIHPGSASQIDDDVSVVEKDEEDDSGTYVSVEEGEEEDDSESESSESTSSNDSSDDSEESGESGDSNESKESIDKTPEEMIASLQKKFPDISTEPPSEEQKQVLEKIATFFRDEKIAIGNYKSGSVKACTGYSPMKDGGILLYF